MLKTRHLIRQKIVQAIFCFDWYSGEKNISEVFESILEKKEENSFAKKVLNSFESDFEKIKKLIEKYAKDWSIDRISRIDRALLFAGISEMLDPEEDVNFNIIINEYIDLAKEFSGGKSPSFINGVLDSVKKELEEELGITHKSEIAKDPGQAGTTKKKGHPEK